MIARGLTPEDAATMVGQAIAKGETVCAIVEPGGTYTVTTEVHADIDPNPTRARPFILSDHGEFLRRWHGGDTGRKG